MARIWTENEKKYLFKKYPLQSAETTAKKLNRSTVSIIRKARQLGVSIYFENIHASTIAYAFNIEIGTVKKWIENYGLPCNRIVEKNFTRYNIEPVKFWDWAYEHKDIINWSKYKSKSILPEPNWLNEAIQSYHTPNTRLRFSEEEIISIREMIMKQNLPYKEIARRTGRTYQSIKNFARRY